MFLSCRGAAETAVSRLDQREHVVHEAEILSMDTIFVEHVRETYSSPETCYVNNSEKIREIRIRQVHDTIQVYKDSVQVHEVTKVVPASPSRWQRWKNYIIVGFLLSLIFTMLFGQLVGRR